jgi:hypothetical protein
MPFAGAFARITSFIFSCCSRLSVALGHLAETAITSATTESHASYDLPSFVAVATVCLQAICLRSSGNSSLA